jgi:hypothetical protein
MMHSTRHHIQLLGFCVLILAASTSSFAQRKSAKASPSVAIQTKVNMTQLSLEEPGAAMVFGPDGMLYVLTSYGGRYRKGTISKLNPEAFSRPQRTKDGHNRALPEDLTEVYVFGGPGETTARGKRAEFNNGPRVIILGTDGKLYISGDDDFCVRFDPATQAVEWIKLGPDFEDFSSREPGYSPSREPDYQFLNASGDCFAVTQDGLLWCKAGGKGRAGRVFHTRGIRKDLGQILGTEQWKYASLAADGYFYGATDDALVRVKSDGSDITVLHAFTGKDDHPLGAPILIGNMLYGYAHDEPKESGVKPSAGYIYKLNSDGTGYPTVIKLEYDPKGPLLSQGTFLYGMAEPVTRERIFDVRGENFRRDRSVIPGGFFRMAVDSATSTLIAPTKETIVPDAMIIYNGAAYVLTHSSQVDNSIFRIPIGDGVSPTVQSGTGQTTGSSAVASAVAPTGAAPSNPAPASSAAPALGGKSVFHKRQSTDDSQGAEETSAGSSSNATDEGMSSKPRPGLPPRQSKPPAQVSSSVAPTRDAAPPPADETTGVAASNAAPPASAAPVPGGKSVFHKRQSSDDSQGAPPDAEGASAGRSPNGADEGMATQARPGLPPRQSKAPAKAPSTSADSESSFSSSKESLTPEQFAKLKAERRMANTGRKSERDDVASSGTSSLAGSSMSDNSDASGIAEKVVQAFSDGDVETLGALYADTVDYYDSGRISSADVRSQLQEYFSKWPVRQWTITSPVKVQSLGASRQQVVFSAKYDLSDPDSHRHASGIAKETIVVAADSSGAMKIISHHEKTIPSKARLGSKKAPSDRPEREKVYDGRPVIPLPPNIPWPPGIPHP